MVTMQDVIVEQERRRQERLVAASQLQIRWSEERDRGSARQTVSGRVADWLHRSLLSWQRQPEGSQATPGERMHAPSGC